MTGPRYLGLDLGGTNLKVSVLEIPPGGEPHQIASATAPTHARLGPEAVIGRLVEVGRQAVALHGPVRATGLGIPGLFDPGSGEVTLVPNLSGQWQGQPLRDRLAAGMDTAVYMINDARAFTLAEARLGAGRGSATLVGITLGTGVGGGVVIDGRLHTGATGIAGEVGHQTVQPGGPRCGCGNHGCAEAVAQASALAALAGRDSADQVFAAARAGDQRCQEAIETVAGHLGVALANTVAVLGADTIVVGGGIAAAGELLLTPLREAVRRRVTLIPPQQVTVTVAALGDTAGALGAALISADRSG